MPGCCAFGCHNRDTHGKKFFCIPCGKENEGRRKIWLHRIGRANFEPRSARLCEVLLVSSSSAPDRWIVPGGGLEPNEEPSTAAMREVMEEGGVRGRLGRCLGTFEECEQRVLLRGSTFGTKSPDEMQLNSERKHRTMVFILEVTEELEEWEDSKNIGRKRKWFPIDEALRVLSVSKPVQCNYVKLLMKNDKVP